jgi:hypothetical protein
MPKLMKNLRRESEKDENSMNHATLRTPTRTLEQNYGSVCAFVPLQGLTWERNPTQSAQDTAWPA